MISVTWKYECKEYVETWFFAFGSRFIYSRRTWLETGETQKEERQFDPRLIPWDIRLALLDE